MSKTKEKKPVHTEPDHIQRLNPDLHPKYVKMVTAMARKLYVAGTQGKIKVNLVSASERPITTAEIKAEGEGLEDYVEGLLDERTVDVLTHIFDHIKEPIEDAIEMFYGEFPKDMADEQSKALKALLTYENPFSTPEQTSTIQKEDES